MNIQIAIIEPNNLIFNSKEEIINMTTEIMANKIGKYIKIITILHENLMENVIKYTKLTPELMGDTSKCHESHEHIYQICHLNMKHNGKTNDENNINHIGSYLALDKEQIHGNCILIKSKIGNDGICIGDSILDIHEIANLLYMRIVHKCIKISSDDNIEECTFVETPMEFMNDFDKNNYRSIELSFLKFNLLLLIQMDHDGKINKIATRLSGKYLIFGTVILIGKSSENDFINIDIDLFKKIDKVAWGTLDNRIISKEDDVDGETKDGMTIVNNSYCILESKYISDIKKNGKYICTGCYRQSYLSIDDQKNDWQYHRNDCIKTKKCINDDVKYMYKLECEKEEQERQDMLRKKEFESE